MKILSAHTDLTSITVDHVHEGKYHNYVPLHAVERAIERAIELVRHTQLASTDSPTMVDTTGELLRKQPGAKQIDTTDKYPTRSLSPNQDTNSKPLKHKMAY